QDLDLGTFPFMGIQLHPAVARPVLAADEVHFVGDAVAVIAATTKAAAVDAVEAVEVDYEPLPVVIDMEAALAPGAPVLFEKIGSNLVLGSRGGEKDGLEGAEGM